MSKFFKLNKLILQTFFLYIFILINSSIGLERYNDGVSISNYFSGVISLQDNKYKNSYEFFKTLENLEDKHTIYSKSYIETLVNNSKINEAFRYSNKLKKKGMSFFFSDIVTISKFIKNGNFNKANNYFNSTENRKYTPLQDLISQIIFSWVKIEESKLNYNEALEVFELINPKYKNIKNINNVFLNCYFDTANTETKFKNLVDDKNTDFSRYAFFYANYLLKKRFNKKSKLSLKQKID